MGEKSLKNYTIQEYLEIDNQSDEKCIFKNGLIESMSGGTLNHGIIGNNINGEIRAALQSKKSNCTGINGDVRIFIKKANSFVYPDGMVVCGDIEISEQDKHSIINPTLVIEVLSKSTESYDRGDKFHKYCSLSSFKEYILIDQYKPVVDLLHRLESGRREMITAIGLDKSIYINSVGVFVKMEDIYRNTLNLASPNLT